jgi:hypothetical protein
MRMERSTERGHGAAAFVDFRAPEENPRHEALRQDISARLRNSCSHLSEEEFAALVEKMLKVQLKGERRFSAHYPAAT